MLFSLPISALSQNQSSSIITGSCTSSSVHPRPNERFCIPRPISWGSRHECVGGGWHDEHKDKIFRTLQYRKDRAAPWHEFILLFLTDGSVCRVERMGDATPGRRHDALFSKGIAAVDFMQVFPPSEKHMLDIGLGNTDLVAEIRYPVDLKLLSVLDICYAIQLDSEAKRYTLLIFNCYFFVWSIILILGRQVAQWESAFREPDWNTACARAIESLNSISSNQSSKLAFRLEKVLADPSKETINEVVAQHIQGQNTFLDLRAKSLLWTKQAPEIIKQRLEHLIRHSISEKTFRNLFPEFGRFSLKSPVTPIETLPWERDQQASPDSPKPSTSSFNEYMESKAQLSPDSHTGLCQLPTLSSFLQAPMYETSSLVLNAFYSGIRSITQSEQSDSTKRPNIISSGDWRSHLSSLLAEAVDKSHDPTFENKFLSLFDSCPGVQQTEWRQVLIQACDEQVPFFKTSPLPRLWDQWLWEAINQDITDEIGALIPKSELVNIGVTRPERGQEWMTNGQLQTYINERMKEHSQVARKLNRQTISDVYNEISEAIEGVWERVSLGDGKRDCLGLASVFRSMHDVLVPSDQNSSSTDRDWTKSMH